MELTSHMIDDVTRLVRAFFLWMGVELTTLEITIDSERPQGISIAVASPHAPLLIWHNGITLQAISDLIGRCIRRQCPSIEHAQVDVNAYFSEKRACFLQFLDQSVQSLVLREKVEIPALTSHERKIAHDYILAHYPSLRSYSRDITTGRILCIERVDPLQAFSPHSLSPETIGI